MFIEDKIETNSDCFYRVYGKQTVILYNQFDSTKHVSRINRSNNLSNDRNINNYTYNKKHRKRNNKNFK